MSFAATSGRRQNADVLQVPGRKSNNDAQLNNKWAKKGGRVFFVQHTQCCSSFVADQAPARTVRWLKNGLGCSHHHRRIAQGGSNVGQRDFLPRNPSSSRVFSNSIENCLNELSHCGIRGPHFELKPNALRMLPSHRRIFHIHTHNTHNIHTL